MPMAYRWAALLVVAMPTVARANSFPEMVDQVFASLTGWFVRLIFYEIPFQEDFRVPWVLIVLIAGALYFTLRFGLPQFKYFWVAIDTVRGKYDAIDSHSSIPVAGDPTPTQGDDIPETIKVEGSKGEVSHFQALTAALSATVGLGNIAGVAVAISVGGPGATFWMILAGLLGMASKFAECTLGVKYRDIDENGIVYGGPMYYLSKGLREIGLARLGKVLAAIFAVMVIGGSFGGGNMFQANQAAEQFAKLFNIEHEFGRFYFGIVMAILVALVIIGGIKRIGKVTEKLVPFMAGIYVLGALVIIFSNLHHLPKALELIVTEAFTGTGIAGGFLGVLIQGFRRGTFSNEAGVGSAAIAHSAVVTRFPASEGIVALLEPFVDTVVICTMTALVLIITNLESGLFTYGNPIDKGVELTANAFDSVIPHFSVVLTIAVILFAFSTMISWSYYGMQGWMYLFGRSKVSDLTYKLLFLVFLIVGSGITLKSVLDFSDAMIFAMVVPNIIGVVLLTPRIKEEVVKYIQAIRSNYR